MSEPIRRALGRRDFLELCGLVGTSPWTAALGSAALAGCRSPRPSRGPAADVAVLGGGLGGCAAALAACESGAAVVLCEESPWIGGQLTSQAVPPDEHRFVETHGTTASYRALREAIRDHYRSAWPLTEAARSDPRLNPGAGWVSRLCCEPGPALQALAGLLAPHVASGRLTVRLRARPLAVTVERDFVRAVELESETGRFELSAACFVDATEDGVLLALGGIEHATGSEARAKTCEPHAAEVARPDNVQACTWVFALEHRSGEDWTLSKPESYERWRAWTPPLEPPWPGPLFGWSTTHPRTLAPRDLTFSPLAEDAGLRGNLWTYRRVRRASILTDPARAFDATLVNWPQNDYLLGDPMVGPTADRERHARGARALSRSLLYWLQTEAPRPDGGVGWPGLRLCPEVSGTPDGLALRPYVRESRRIVAERTLVEQDIEPAARRAVGEEAAQAFRDSIGVGHYGEIDLHPSVAGDNYRSLGCLPFQIPLGCLLPVRVENLLPAAKNVGTTHLTNGVCRLHPIEWNLGEVAGALAAFSVGRQVPLRAVRADPALLDEFQSLLVSRGVELSWT